MRHTKLAGGASLVLVVFMLSTYWPSRSDLPVALEQAPTTEDERRSVGKHISIHKGAFSLCFTFNDLRN